LHVARISAQKHTYERYDDGRAGLNGSCLTLMLMIITISVKNSFEARLDQLTNKQTKMQEKRRNWRKKNRTIFARNKNSIWSKDVDNFVFAVAVVIPETEC
jgi:hypothetical protein